MNDTITTAGGFTITALDLLSTELPRVEVASRIFPDGSGTECYRVDPGTSEEGPEITLAVPVWLVLDLTVGAACPAIFSTEVEALDEYNERVQSAIEFVAGG